MIAPARQADLNPQESGFLDLLPLLEKHARKCFRYISCPSRRGDLIAETIGLAWGRYCRLLEQGKNVWAFPVAFACLVVRAVKSGRRLCGQDSATDALSWIAQQRRSFTVVPFPQERVLGRNDFDEALQDNTRSSVPDQVAFRIDFRDWLKSLSDRNRAIVCQLALGYTPQEVARRFGVCAGRISQLRRDFHDEWHTFCDPVAS